MELSDIAQSLGCAFRGDAQISGITHDSRQVKPGYLYVAVPGLTQHGITFASQAVAAGAVAIASDADAIAQLSGDVPALIFSDVRRDMGLASAMVYGHPEKSLSITGITGTNGKTTTSMMVAHIIHTVDEQVGVIGTLGTRIGKVEIPSSRTTPESTDLYRTFASMVEAGSHHVVMEVSSHALELQRVAGVQFSVAAFTNLTQDHLDFHGNMNNYFAAKSKLFSMCDSAVINIDDEFGRKLASQLHKINVLSVGQNGDYKVTNIAQSLKNGLTFDFESPEAKFSINLPMVGEYNATNAAMAIAICAQLKISPEVSGRALQSFLGVPGRCEMVSANVPAIVDYAHTPDAVDKVLSAIRNAGPKRLITVIGCGGDRDQSKRPIMGQVAGRLSDLVIVTDDNPRSENPEMIRAQVLAGVNQTPSSVIEIGERREAIRYGLEHATSSDVVVVLGKGHETGQEIAGVVHPFDDREVIRQESRHA